MDVALARRLLEGSAMGTIIDRLNRHVATQPDRDVYTFLGEGGARQGVSYAALDLGARRVAAALAHLPVGARVLLLFPPSVEFVEALFGCFRAGVVAVPGHVPTPSRLAQTLPRLRAMIADCEPAAVLTTSALLPARALVPELARVPAIAVDQLDDVAPDDAESRALADELAILQYSSGSTGTPRGVMVTHANLMHNEALIEDAFEHTSETVVVGWLPFQHDMGLIGNVLQPVYAGATCALMSPIAFLKHPLRWLQEITRFRATTSGAPNFAYDACVAAAQRHGVDHLELDLSSWSLAFVGAEPVRAATLDRFAKTFEPYGFRREAFYPCYGLAEATLMVSGGERAELPVEQSIRGHVRTGCGVSRPHHAIAIVDPLTCRRQAPGSEGEIWVRGPSVARGYFRDPERTRERFHAMIAGEAGEWLRTGDLGTIADGELFITGRIKDVVVVRGMKLAAEDIEDALVHDERLRPSACVAFAHDDGASEQLVIVHEIERGATGPFDDVASKLASSVLQLGGAAADIVALVRPGNIPRTTSGKVRRGECQALFARGALDVVHRYTRAS